MRAQRIHKSALLWDNHGCMPLKADAEFLPQLQRYRDAGVSVASINIGMAEMAWESQVAILRFMRSWIGRHPEHYRLAANVDDLLHAKSDGKLAVVFDVEGMNLLGDHLERVDTLYALGVRWMLLAYNRNNAFGGGCLDTDGGLTPRGRNAIDALERAGMVLCLSHTGIRTAEEALDHACKPVIFSHSNPAAVHPHARNISDGLIRKCASGGGVIGINGIGPFLGARTALVDQMLRNILHVVDLVGPGHVGIALDYVFDAEGLAHNIQRSPQLYPPDLRGGLAMVAPEQLYDVCEGLARTNLSDTTIANILGGNWLRVATQVWK